MKKTIAGLGALLLLASVSTAQVDASHADTALKIKALKRDYAAAKTDYVAARKALMKT